MRTCLLAIIIFSSGLLAVSAQESPAFKRRTESFEHQYNAGQYDSVFQSFADNMKVAVPREKLLVFLQNLKTQHGFIVGLGFLLNLPVHGALYQMQFANGTANLEIGLDDLGKITRLYVRAMSGKELPAPERNATQMSLPFAGEWYVLWGGDTRELNYHTVSKAQKGAFDFLIRDAAGQTFSGNRLANESYYAFGKEILSPVDGIVSLVVDGVKDNAIGETNTFNVGGNMIIIKAGDNEYVALCHFKHQSIKVKEGQVIKTGELIGLCGNTGNSSEPHLHMHLQNTENIDYATGMKCFFHRLAVNGEIKTDYSPQKNEKIKLVN